MIESIRNWIVNICTIIIFLTAVDMLLPKNNIKKYAKYVLGLILTVTLIQPLIVLVNGDIDLSEYISSSESYYSTDVYANEYETYKQQNLDNTLSVFKINLELELKNKLKSMYSGSEFEVYVDLDYQDVTNEFMINYVEIGVRDGSVVRVEEVKIGEENDKEDTRVYLDNDKSSKIKKLISSELYISENNIYIYELK